MTLDDTLLADFTRRFVTYGNRRGKLWFIDVEDDHLNDSDAIATLLGNWRETGCREQYRLGELDGAKAPEESPQFDLHRAGGPLLHQPFSVKSRIACGFDGEMPASPEAERRIVRIYQASRLGTPDGDTCLLGIVPIPYWPTEWWPHSENSALPEMSSKRAFEKAFVVPRLERARALIGRHRPRALVSFGWRWRTEIESVFGPFDEEIVRGRRTVRFGRRGRTLIVLTNDRRYHRAPSTEFCWWLGGEIAARSARLRAESGKSSR